MVKNFKLNKYVCLTITMGILFYMANSFFSTRAPKTIIAFGDSLTRGLQISSGRFDKETPYTDYLKPMLGNGWKVRNKGISGELTHEMLERFSKDVVIEKPDVVVILGGSNDVGWGVPAETVIENLKTIIQQAIDAGIKPIPCAIPSIMHNKKLVPPRRKINLAIALFAKNNGIPFVDLFSATSDEGGMLARQYSSDGLHLSTKGYKLMAKTIYEQGFKKIE